MTFREIKLLAITAGLIVAGVLGQFVLAPLLAKNEQLNSDIRAARMRLKKSLTLLSQEGFFSSRYPQLYAAMQQRENEGQGSTTSLAELENMARAARLTVTDLRPQGADGKGASAGFLVEMRAEGDIEGQMRFLYEFEQSLSLLKVKRFALSVKPRSQVLEGRYTIAVSGH